MCFIKAGPTGGKGCRALHNIGCAVTVRTHPTKGHVCRVLLNIGFTVPLKLTSHGGKKQYAYDEVYL